MNQALVVPTEVKTNEPSASLVRMMFQMESRDLVAVQKQINDIVKSDLDIAMACSYWRPVGKGPNGRQEFATGVSVRLTEIGQQCFGGIWLSEPMIDVDIGKGRVEVVVRAFDLRTVNIYHGNSGKSIKKRNGDTFSDSMIEVIILACSSIARRNAIQQACRPQLDAAIKAAKARVIEHYGKDLNSAWSAVCERYAKRWGTTVDQIKCLVADEATKVDQLWMAIGVYNYLAEQDDSAYNDVFGAYPKSTAPQHPAKPVAPQKTAAESHTSQENADPGEATSEPPSVPQQGKAAKKQTSPQEYATLKLQLTAMGKEQEFADALTAFERAVCPQDKWTHEDYDIFNKALRKIVADQPPA